MIEVNLFSVNDPNSMYGRCVARSRFDAEAMNVGVMEFVHGFLKDSLDNYQSGVSSELVNTINSDFTMTIKDFSSINYLLGQAGYKITIWNVADDEEDAEGVPNGNIVEWNVIDHNYTQNDYPTTTKIIPGSEQSISEVVKTIAGQVDLFSEEKFSGVRNPIKALLKNLEDTTKITGAVSSSSVTKIYSILSDCGVEVFCALSEA